ncbi:MAG: AsmA family protein [Candidatus Binatia bacterium]
MNRRAQAMPPGTAAPGAVRFSTLALPIQSILCRHPSDYVRRFPCLSSCILEEVQRKRPIAPETEMIRAGGASAKVSNVPMLASSKDDVANENEKGSPQRSSRRSPWKRVLRAMGYTAAFLGLGLLLLVGVLALGAERLTPYVTGAISSATGREFHIEGDVRARVWSWRPRLIVEKISFANPSWSEEKQMLEVGRLQVGIALRRLLRGDIVIPTLRVDDAVVRLEQRADGTDNWTLWASEAARPDDRTEVPVVRRLRIRKARVLYTREGRPGAATDLQIADARGTIATEVQLEGKGKYQGHPARISMKAGSIDQLHDEDAPFPINIDLDAGATSATIVGTLQGALDEGGLDVKLTLKGDSLSELYPLLGVVLPMSPPYQLVGGLERDGSNWKFSDFAGRLGDSDLSGNLTVDVAPVRPVMNADLQSKLLDFDDLAGLIGAPPPGGKGETASADQKAQAAAMAAEGRVLPSKPMDIPRLHAMDIHARLVATRVDAPEHLPMDRLDLRISLVDGTLKAEPASFNVAGGRVDLFATVHSDRDPLRADVELRARGLEASKILGPTPFTKDTAGKLGGDVKVAMRGNSLRDMAATADGTLQLALADGQVSKLLVELIGLDLMKSIGVLLRGDEPLEIRCAAFDLVAENGKLRSNMAVIDTEDSNITAEIALDLETERVDARIVPHPKDVSLLSLRQDLRVEGTFADLDFYPDPLKLGRVGGLMQKLNFALAPIVGLLTPFDVKTQDRDDDNGCSAFLKEQGGPDSKAVGSAEPKTPRAVAKLSKDR